MEKKTFIVYDKKKNHRWYCGLDVHKHQLAVAMYSPTMDRSESVKATIFSTSDEGLADFWNFALKYRPVGFAMEATGIYHHIIYNLLAHNQKSCKWKFRIVIVNPADVSGIPGRSKNDKIDAVHLAQYLAAGLLKGGKPPLEAIEDLKALFRMIDRLTRVAAAHKNRIKKTLDRAGLRMKEFRLDLKWTLAFIQEFIKQTKPLGEFLHEALEQGGALFRHRKVIKKNECKFTPFLTRSLTPAQRVLIRQELIDLTYQELRKEVLKVELDTLIEAHPLVKMHAHNLSTIPGIGISNALWILVEIGDISRFPNSRKFLTYCGCAPRIVESADKVYSAHAQRHSNSYLRKIFYQAGFNLCTVVKQPSELKDYANKTHKRKWTPKSKLSYYTIASKVALVAYSILKNKQPFDPEHSMSSGKSPRKPSDFGLTFSDKKSLRHIKNCLKRLDLLDARLELGIVSEDTLYMIEELENLLSRI